MAIHLEGQCLISNLELTPTECNPDGKFFVQINFNHMGTGTQFRILGNGRNYGTFRYSDLPVIIGPLDADCNTVFEFAVRDVDNPNCLSFKGLGKVCCNQNCKLAINESAGYDCTGSLYTLRLNLSHNQPSTGKFRLFSNGIFINEYSYGQLPLVVPNVRSSISATFNDIVVCASNNMNCCDTLKLLNPCICSIYDMRVQVAECDSISKKFGVRLNFRHNLTSDSFQIGGNVTNYGKYAYKDLPVSISNLDMDSIKDYEFLAIDLQDAFCFSSYELGVVDSCNYSCKISAQLKGITECTDGKFFADIQLQASNQGFSGIVVHTNDFVDTIPDGVFTYRAGPFSSFCDSEKLLNIYDAEDEMCATPLLLEGPICCLQDSCNLTGIIIAEECENNQLIGFDLYVNFAGNISDSFQCAINGTLLGTFSYSALPVRISNTDLLLPYVKFNITDSRDNQCSLDTNYVFKCFPVDECKINEFKVLNGTCENDSLYVSFNVQATGTGNLFYLMLNGIIQDSFNYQNQNFVSGPFLLDCPSQLPFRIQDELNESCSASLIFSYEDCCEICKDSLYYFFNLEECINGKFDFSINFLYNGVSDSFDLYLNNAFYGAFAYNQLPVRLANLNGFEGHVLEIRHRDSRICGFIKEIIHESCSTTVKEVNPRNFNIIQKPGILIIENITEIKKSFILRLYDLTGQCFLTSLINEQYYELSTQNFPPGILLISLWYDDKLETHKFLNSK